MAEEKKHNCPECALRKRAEENPRSFLGVLWKLHTYVCPGWKAYQRSLKTNGASGSSS
jgi:hypothetical protein